MADVPLLLQDGATLVVAQEYEASLRIIGEVMRRAQLEATARRERGPEEPAPRLDAHPGGLGPSLDARLPSGLEVESLSVHEGAWIAGRTLAEAELRARTGASLIAVSRGEATAVHPSSDDLLEVGDVVCLVGSAPQITAARDLLDAGPKD